MLDTSAASTSAKHKKKSAQTADSSLPPPLCNVVQYANDTLELPQPLSPFRCVYFKDQAIPVVPDHLLSPLQGNANAKHPRWTQQLWLDAVSLSSSMHKRLHEELQCLCNYAVANEGERLLRMKTLDRLRKTLAPINQLHSFDINMFGSSCSEFTLPTSGIDIGICPNSSTRAAWETMTSEVRRDHSILLLKPLVNLLRPIGYKLFFVWKAHHPVIKYVDRLTNIDVDVSVQLHGQQTIEIVHKITSQYPALRLVVIFFKLLFQQCNMHISGNGGMGGYCCISLVYGILKRMEKQGENVENGGKLLMTVLHFYGFVHKSAIVGIDVINDGALFHRGSHLSKTIDSAQPVLITSIQDQDPPENVSRNVKRCTQFQGLFQQVFINLLSMTVSPNKTDPVTTPCPSVLLERIIYILPAFEQIRADAARLLQRMPSLNNGVQFVKDNKSEVKRQSSTAEVKKAAESGNDTSNQAKVHSNSVVQSSMTTKPSTPAKSKLTNSNQSLKPAKSHSVAQLNNSQSSTPTQSSSSLHNNKQESKKMLNQHQKNVAQKAVVQSSRSSERNVKGKGLKTKKQRPMTAPITKDSTTTNVNSGKDINIQTTASDSLKAPASQVLLPSSSTQIEPTRIYSPKTTKPIAVKQDRNITSQPTSSETPSTGNKSSSRKRHERRNQNNKTVRESSQLTSMDRLDENQSATKLYTTMSVSELARSISATSNGSKQLEICTKSSQSEYFSKAVSIPTPITTTTT